VWAAELQLGMDLITVAAAGIIDFSLMVMAFFFNVKTRKQDKFKVSR